MLRCITCNVNLISEDNYSKFSCPICGGVEIIRCEKCRRNGNTYKCSECGFEGP